MLLVKTNESRWQHWYEEDSHQCTVDLLLAYPPEVRKAIVGYLCARLVQLAKLNFYCRSIGGFKHTRGTGRTRPYLCLCFPEACRVNEPPMASQSPSSQTVAQASRLICAPGTVSPRGKKKPMTQGESDLGRLHQWGSELLPSHVFDSPVFFVIVITPYHCVPLLMSARKRGHFHFSQGAKWRAHLSRTSFVDALRSISISTLARPAPTCQGPSCSTCHVANQPPAIHFSVKP